MARLEKNILYFATPVVQGKQCNWQASEASETLSGVYKLKKLVYMYVSMYVVTLVSQGICSMGIYKEDFC